MALTNAEKQYRHRQRIKAKLQQADGKVCAEEIEAFRKECDAEIANYQSRPGYKNYSMTDLLVGMLRGETTELQGPFLARALNLPSDPWPGLTYDELTRMTKGRLREAKQRGIPAGSNGPYEVDFIRKLMAAKNRAWLEQA